MVICIYINLFLLVGFTSTTAKPTTYFFLLCHFIKFWKLYWFSFYQLEMNTKYESQSLLWYVWEIERNASSEDMYSKEN